MIRNYGFPFNRPTSILLLSCFFSPLFLFFSHSLSLPCCFYPLLIFYTFLSYFFIFSYCSFTFSPLSLIPCFVPCLVFLFLLHITGTIKYSYFKEFATDDVNSAGLGGLHSCVIFIHKFRLKYYTKVNNKQ